LTTRVTLPGTMPARGTFNSKQHLVVAGLPIARKVFEVLDPSLEWQGGVEDGTEVEPGTALASIIGAAGSLLAGERVALNFLQHLSGIATETARYVDAVGGTKAIITDTRKTVPGLRLLEKYAVRVGGGHNHRLNLSDGVLIKDNHLAILRSRGVGLGEVVKRARKNAPRTMKVEVEIESVKQAREALSAGADIIMLDNMNLKDMRRVVKLAHGRALLEASGGIMLDNVRSVAGTGVDLISVGALTHSAKALDISLEVLTG